jgi:hypothetical protein
VRRRGSLECGAVADDVAARARSPVRVHGATSSGADVLTDCCDKFGHHTRQPAQKLLESHRRIAEIRRLLTKDVDEAFGIEVEQIAEKDIRRLHLDSLGKFTEVLEVRRQDDLCARLHRGGSNVTVLLVVLHRGDQVLVPAHRGIRECVLHDRTKTPGLVVGHDARRDEVSGHLVEDLRRPPHLVEASGRRAEQRVPQREREQHVRVQKDDEGLRNQFGE